MFRDRRRWALLAAAVFCCAAAAPPAGPHKVIARIDLSKPFHLPAGATFTATQGPEVDDPVYEGERAPGQIHLCLQISASAACSPNLNDAWKTGGIVDEYSEIHFLDQAEIIQPNGNSSAPRLLLRTRSFQTGDGDQFHSVQIVGYRARERRFLVVFREQSGGNNNQEIRLVKAGPLAGAVISNNPADNAPFGYWITVYRASAGGDYRQILHYRSATRYNDGNPLAVIDSEMPNILQRLRLWRPGLPLPLPAGRCPRPHLVKSELWCS